MSLNCGHQRAYCSFPREPRWSDVTHRPDDGRSSHLRNVVLLLRDYTVLWPRRLSWSLKLMMCVSLDAVLEAVCYEILELQKVYQYTVLETGPVSEAVRSEAYA